MKRLISILSAVSLALVLLLGLDQTAVTAKAEGNTYVLHWSSSKSCWIFQSGSKWDASAYSREKYYLDQDLKDGDLIVVDDNAPSSKNVLQFDAHLGNVTVTPGNAVVVYANGIDEFYALDASSVSVNSEVQRAHIYDAASVTLQDNVDYLEILTSSNDPYKFSANVTCVKKVAEMETHSSASNKYHIVNVKENKFEMVNGLLYTDKADYSEYGAADIVKVTSLGSASGTPAKQPAKNGGDSGYDEVPKTGTDYSLAIILLSLGTLFLGAQFLFKKTRRV